MNAYLEALVRTARPLAWGTAFAIAVYTVFQLFTPMQIVGGLTTAVAVYMIVLIYQMNLHSVRKERESD